MENSWYRVSNEKDIDSPTLLVYPERIKKNIATAISMVDDVRYLRPHVKTNKSPQVCQLMIEAGITRFKCATIAEGEMLAAAKAKDVLLAYQPVGPKIKRLLELSEAYPDTTFSCLIDNIATASELSSQSLSHNRKLNVFIDLNVGMNRTGVAPENAFSLIEGTQSLRGIQLIGLHTYDGHLRDTNFTERKQKSDTAFLRVQRLKERADNILESLQIVAGGTPTFSIHCQRKNIECSPGTFIYWDNGYDQILPEQEFEFAAVVVSRVISKPAENLICVDLGHKAIASENPLEKRVHFLNAPDLIALSHSEEHLTLEVTDGKSFAIGEVLYGVPYHICPTVALHDQAGVVTEGKVKSFWNNVSRTRKITI